MQNDDLTVALRAHLTIIAERGVIIRAILVVGSLESPNKHTFSDRYLTVLIKYKR